MIRRSGDVEFITFPAFEGRPELVQAFSTRIGGVSEGMFSSMNLGRMQMDDPEKVRENFRRFCGAIGISADNIVMSEQQHTTNIRIATAADRGKGLWRERDYEAIDGLITNEKNVALCLSFADCVPVYMYDPVNHAIALVHSGWKGTVGHISAKAAAKMFEQYGSRAEDLIAVIGPSICRDCYEVSEDLYEAFSETFTPDEVAQIFSDELDENGVKVPGKYLLDLWLAVRITLRGAGLKEENIHTTDICTCCNSENLFSHRASHGQRGNLAAVMMLR